MIAIMDYGRGNLWSVFPGVGAFRDCMHNLTTTGLDQALREVIGAGRPVLAICVGMQVLLTDSEEFGLSQGLAIIEGHVRRFPSTLTRQASRLKVPHMGWNQLGETISMPHNFILKKVRCMVYGCYGTLPRSARGMAHAADYSGYRYPSW
jgi:imidazole glycerol phosphate synthase glutamine amidotransferase subunit